MYGVRTDENGLYHMRARFYNTEIKRFINQDILREELTNSQSLNRYSYVQGNSVSYTDPFGLSPFKKLSDKVHTVLNFVGMECGWIGALADLTNAGLYYLEGNIKMASLSAVSSLPVVGNVKNIYNNIKNGEIFTKENGLEVLSLGLNIFTAGQAGKSLSKVGKSYAGNSAKKFSKVKESGNAQVPLKYDLQFFGSEWYIFLENR